MELDPKYWSNRYLTDADAWDVGYISTPLKTYFDQLKNKELNILIPGAGNSYEAQYLFESGFRNVTVVDFAKEPLDNLKKRCPTFSSSHLIQQNFFEHQGQYDLIIEQTFFCALDPKLRPAYAKHMHELLKPGGKLVGVLFDDALNADKPPFGGNKAEYKTYFDKYFSYKTFESCYNSIKPRENRELFINLILK